MFSFVQPLATTFCDTDGDTLPNYLDLDSDNDGCVDAREGSQNLPSTSVVTAGGTVTVGTGSTASNQNLCASTTCVNTSGVPTIVSGGQGIGASIDATTKIACAVPFPCNGTAYVTKDAGATYTAVYAIDTTTNPVTFNPIPGAPASNISINATGQNPIDNFIYGINGGSNADKYLYKVDANGVFYNLGLLSYYAPSTPTINDIKVAGIFVNGDFDSAGNYYIKQGISNVIYKINVNVSPITIVPINLSSSINTPDFAYTASDNSLWAVGNEPIPASAATTTRVYSISLNSSTLGNVSTYPVTYPVSSMPAYGSMFSTANGAVYAISNTQTFVNYSGIMQIDKTTGALFRIATNPPAALSSTDALHCNTAKMAFNTDLSITKTDNTPTYLPGSSTTYTIVAKNNGAFGVLNATVTDALPAGITTMRYTAIASSGSTTSVVGTQTGAINDTVALAPGGTVTYNVVVTIPATFTGDLVNTATIAVPADETATDTDPSNNTATDTDTNICTISATNPDTDGDGISNFCDSDDDNDGISDTVEGCYNTEFAGDNSDPTGIPNVVYIAFPFNNSGTRLKPIPSNVAGFLANPTFTNQTPDMTYGAGFTATYSNVSSTAGAYNVTGIDATTLAEAKTNNEYFEFSFTTLNTVFDAYIDWHGFYNPNTLNPNYTVDFNVSNDGFVSNSTSLGPITQVAGEGATSGAAYPQGRRARRNTPYYLAPNTTYTVRIYLYNVGGNTQTVQFDDPILAFDACTRNTDLDSATNNLDLDSDNDGCSDANEYYNSVTADGNDGGVYGTGSPAITATGTVSAASYSGTYTNAINATQGNIATQPANQTTTVGGSTTFTVTATAQTTASFAAGTPNYTVPPATDTTANFTYQWQVSINNGATWTNVTNGGVYSGATTSTLTITGATSTMNGNDYRVLIGHSQNVCMAIISNTSKLCVIDKPTVATTFTSCSAAATATITNYNPNYIYTFAPTGPIAGAGGVITGMVLETNYTLTATNSIGCLSQTSDVFSIHNYLGTADNDFDGQVDFCDLDDDNDGVLDETEYMCGAIKIPAFFSGTMTAQTGSIEVGTTYGLSSNSIVVNYSNYNQQAPSSPFVTDSSVGTGPFRETTYTITSTVPYRLILEHGKVISSNFRTDYFKLVSGASAENFQQNFTPATEYNVVTSGYDLSVTRTSATNNVGTTNPFFEWYSKGLFTSPVSFIAGTSDYGGGNSLYNILLCIPADTDKDGIYNYLDLDSDNDGCSDANEYYASSTADGGDGGVYGTGTPTVTATGTVSSASYTGTYTNAITATQGSITTQPTNQQTTVGGNTTFSVVGAAQSTTTFAAGTPNYTIPPATNTTANFTYQWQVSSNNGATWTNITNGGGYTGATTSTLTITGATATMNGNEYRVLVAHSKNVCMSLVSNASKLCVIDTPLVAITNTTCTAAGTATITNHNVNYNYTFTPSGPTVSGGVISGMVPNTDYTVTATNSSGCTSSISATFRIQDNLSTTDTDADTYVNECDLDDDNDGVLDSVECAPTWAQWTVVDPTPGLGATIGDATVTGTIGSQSITVTATSPLRDPLSVFASSVVVNYPGVQGLSVQALNLLNKNILSLASANASANHTFTFNAPTTKNLYLHIFATDASYSLSSGTIVSSVNGYVTGTQFNLVNNTTIQNDGGFSVFLPQGTSSFVLSAVSATSDNYFITITGDCADTDNDGTPNYLDLDSDNDGCSDANEYYASSTADAGDGGVYGTGTPTVTATGTVSSASYTGTYTNAVTATQGSITTQPTNQQTTVGGTTTFSVVGAAQSTTTFAAGTPNYTIPPATDTTANFTYQWQVSTNNGATWTNVTNGGVYSGATTSTLTITGATAAMNGYDYQVLVGHSQNACIALVSNASNLCVIDVPTIVTTNTTCSAEGTATITNFNVNYNYTFTPTGPTVSGGVISGVEPNTEYTVTATNSLGCTTNASYSFRIEDILSSADNDRDGIVDDCDLDDDNDGVLDTEEYCAVTYSGRILVYNQGNSGSFLNPTLPNTASVPTALDEVAGAGLTISQTNTEMLIQNADATTYQEAKVNNDYVEFNFDTSSTVGAGSLINNISISVPNRLAGKYKSR